MRQQGAAGFRMRVQDADLFAKLPTDDFNRFQQVGKIDGDVAWLHFGLSMRSPSNDLGSDEDTVVRHNAMYALGSIGPTAADAMPALVMVALKNENSGVRRRANYALGTIPLQPHPFTVRARGRPMT
jgi:hypothetical protein